VLKIEFSDEDKIEYSEKASENRKKKKLENEAKAKIERAKTAKARNAKPLIFREENLEGDNMAMPDDNEILEEVLNMQQSSNKKKLAEDFKPTYSTEDFISTINKIKENPENFKFTNKVYFR
jgi:hypothetical protein